MPRTDSQKPQWEALGTFVRTRREELRLTIGDAARLAGVGDVTWSDIEKGRSTNPRPATLRRIADVTGRPEHIFELAGRRFVKTSTVEPEGARPAPEARRELEELLKAVPSLSAKARRVLVDMFDLVASSA